ncbi:hypothetical protein NQ318_009839 [Aromia moschata]|uniref:Uncharacterized protein n=1 Tax=Aromia moschata TaxID=1265417 RepID=A0AAV8XMK9_9CUCU|nr:hypothetical protein NQ318_009839 [Aromia moschata]
MPKIKSLEAEKLNIPHVDVLGYRKLDRDIKRLNTENKFHKLKAQEFYKRKRDAKNRSQKCVSTEAICFDFAKIFRFRILLQMTYIIKGSCPYIHLIFIFSLHHKAFYIYIRKS